MPRKHQQPRTPAQVRADNIREIKRLTAETPAAPAAEEKPETQAEYLLRLAADCQESGNTAHAEDHFASANSIQRLTNALRGMLNAYRPPDDSAMNWDELDLAAEVATTTLASVQTLEAALAAAGID